MAAAATQRTNTGPTTEGNTTVAHDIESMALGTPKPLATEAASDISDLAEKNSATATCARPNADATPVELASPEMPASLNGASASAAVRVGLDAAGHIVSATIVHSTGNSDADAAALTAARASTFRAGYKNCEPVAGEYLVTFDFE